MMMWKRLVLTVLLVGLCVPGAFAGSLDQDELRKAAAHGVDLLASKGAQGLIELESYRFCDGKGYIIVTDMEGLVFIHTGHPALKGHNSLGITDAKGEAFGLNIKNKATSGGGMLDYWWMDAATKKPVRKSMYITTGKLDDIPVVVAVGSI